MTMLSAYVTPYLGWMATIVFTASYFARRAETLRVLQMAGATLWLLYGVAIRATPVIVANVLVLGAATWTTLAPRVARGGAVRGERAR
ncbi:MAG: hypothetical protein IPK33_25340 [Gemmatimonadetes bacterium]|nr:hypothetical protein [Gemmatimonadota bacterium]MBP9107097.1 hypothetical protein [Gemmatimonadaceae bacterium]